MPKLNQEQIDLLDNLINDIILPAVEEDVCPDGQDFDDTNDQRKVAIAYLVRQLTGWYDE